MNAQSLATVEDRPSAPVVIGADASQFMSIIAQAASDPNFDADKLDRIIGAYERVSDKAAENAFKAALVELKPKLPVIDRKGRIEVRAKGATGERDGRVTQSTHYALWEDIDAAITPILHEHGFVLTFRSGVAQDGKITVTGVLSHNAGHSEETTITLPHDSSGSKNAVQAVGSSTSYGKRYTATMLLNIRTKGEDDDGNSAGKVVTITDEQVAVLREELAKNGGDVIRFCRFVKVDALADIPASRFNDALRTIRERGKAGAR